jgi:hypothetical protein
MALTSTMLHNGLSLGQGLRFLPFFWKGNKIFYPVNPVSQKAYAFVRD